MWEEKTSLLQGLTTFFSPKMLTLPETNIAPNRKVVFQPSIFKGYVSLREGKIFIFFNPTMVSHYLRVIFFSRPTIFSANLGNPWRTSRSQHEETSGGLGGRPKYWDLWWETFWCQTLVGNLPFHIFFGVKLWCPKCPPAVWYLGPGPANLYFNFYSPRRIEVALDMAGGEPSCVVCRLKWI